MSKIFFDVGANYGTDSLPWLVDPEIIVYAFEPTPQLCEHIKAQVNGNPNYILTQKAVSDFNGNATFNIAGQGDWGCSSLLEFSDLSKSEWVGRFDFVVTESIEVDVIRLDGFIAEHGIEHIDYFHCDAQGSDLKVLQGMGDKLQIISHGIIEASNNKEDILYKGQNTLDECEKFLVENGFTIISVRPNDHCHPDSSANEVVIEFQC